MSQLHPIPVSELQQNVFTAIGKALLHISGLLGWGSRVPDLQK